MAKAKKRTPLNVLVNARAAGRLEKESTGAISFQYEESWLGWEHTFAISLSLPLRKSAWRGDAVTAVFDNLLPDRLQIRRTLAERTGANGTDVYSLLEQIGQDCVGAMQFVPDGMPADDTIPITGRPLNDADIESILKNLERAPLGVDPEQEFRISIAGAQEKTALLFHQNQWMQPRGTTPTTHILKPQIGTIQTSTGTLDLTASVDNEHYCLKLAQAFGLPVNRTEIRTFGTRRVLVVERFDRLWTKDGRLLRIPQEDFCQALGLPSSQKYQSAVQGHNTGPTNVDIAKLLNSSDNPMRDQITMFKSQILFWLIGATDGHAKNFSVKLNPGGRFELTPLYDILSAQPAFDDHQIPHGKYKLAMSVGNHNQYQILRILGHHFIETGRRMGLGPTPINAAIAEMLMAGETAAEKAFSEMPKDFDSRIHESISAAIRARLPRLEQLGLGK